ncbi:DUF1697 domain-containing protein [Chachezhania antarctica]|uniref:DUF1697 domain-containing protein n=1 Tax=Chachezhania antarctica TaxID=2340860 RepID=UPI000EB071EE|nr:DUF1697 domain-containing protein [Chachezhania antarctica]
MTAQVILLRGINVGGHGTLSMADLKAHLMGLGAERAETYIQSGNAVVTPAVDPEALADRIEAAQGVRPQVFALTAEEWTARVARNPFAARMGTADPKCLHVFFFDGAIRDPGADRPRLAPFFAVAGPDEEFGHTQGAIWLWAPSGIGRSKLAASMEKLAGIPVTGRNWRTVEAISALVETLR